MQRVKVYRLNSDGLWDDKGTGHVSVEYLEVWILGSFLRFTLQRPRVYLRLVCLAVSSPAYSTLVVFHTINLLPKVQQPG